MLTSRRLRADPALLALLALGLACVAVSQLWRAHVAFDYQRVVYYAGVGLALLLGAAFVRYRAHVAGSRSWCWRSSSSRGAPWVCGCRNGSSAPSPATRRSPGSLAFRAMLDRGALPETERIVSDGCFQFAVPYLVRRPTIPAFSERQVGFVDRLPLARQAAAILAGEPGGAALASRLGVRYAVADPLCAPDLAERLHGTTVLANDGVVVVRLPPSR